MKFTKQDYKIQTKDGFETVSGKVCGNFGFTKSGGYYEVTYIPMGLHIHPHGIYPRLEREAKDLIQIFVDCFGETIPTKRYGEFTVLDVSDEQQREFKNKTFTRFYGER